ncbi:alpha/beta hydrolase [Dactylosporangium sp. NPDC006015]|uniref:alpha/beta hydrolase n=1 Tax=Dactylosporangium sp. NPDC006015 TaxID=3154576 RepID=UPI00339F81A0
MTGFDAAKVDAESFPGGTHRSLVVVNIGKPGPDAWRGRLRLADRHVRAVRGAGPGVVRRERRAGEGAARTGEAVPPTESLAAFLDGLYTGAGNACVDGTVKRYLLDGVLPRHDSEC